MNSSYIRILELRKDQGRKTTFLLPCFCPSKSPSWRQPVLAGAHKVFRRQCEHAYTCSLPPFHVNSPVCMTLFCNLALVTQPDVLETTLCLCVFHERVVFHSTDSPMVGEASGFRAGGRVVLSLTPGDVRVRTGSRCLVQGCDRPSKRTLKGLIAGEAQRIGVVK